MTDTDDKPEVQPGPAAIYHDALARGEIELQRCGGCRAVLFYPRISCPHCHSEDLSWEVVSGEGMVYSTTVQRRRPDRGGDFNIAIVELPEGPRLMTRVEGIAPDEVTIGMAVKARIAEKEGTHYLVFEPAEGGSNG